ncbi:MAG: phosphoribosylglycinamide formyltransferase [Chromatiales bacterium]|nr:phosphoribosylglycinamide formyltransferase [Chromatiales bacterium]
MSGKPLSVVVLLSGRGSNFKAILDAVQAGRIPARIAAVISNRGDAAGLDLAREAGIHTEVLDHKAFANRDDFDQALGNAIDRYDPGLVVLAGFMRILGAALVERFTGRIFNIHPSLLPKFRGLHTHRKAIEAGEAEHGASVHFVTAELDGGPVFLQARVPVLVDDDEDVLAARVLAQEHRIYPQAVNWFATGRLGLEGETPVMDGHPLSKPLLMNELTDADF